LFSAVKAEKRCSSNYPLASVMGALIVVDPQHIARYQPAGLYKNRGALKKWRLVREREANKTETGEEKPEKKPAYP
jgi:hypothetical protein